MLAPQVRPAQTDGRTSQWKPLDMHSRAKIPQPECKNTGVRATPSAIPKNTPTGRQEQCAAPAINQANSPLQVHARSCALFEYLACLTAFLKTTTSLPHTHTHCDRRNFAIHIVPHAIVATLPSTATHKSAMACNDESGIIFPRAFRPHKANEWARRESPSNLSVDGIHLPSALVEGQLADAMGLKVRPEVVLHACHASENPTSLYRANVPTAAGC